MKLKIFFSLTYWILQLLYLFSQNNLEILCSVHLLCFLSDDVFHQGKEVILTLNCLRVAGDMFKLHLLGSSDFHTIPPPK